MPKEVFKGPSGDLAVGWWSSENIENGKVIGEYVGPWVDLSVGGLGKFQFVDTPEYEFDRLYMQIDSVEEVDRLIKVLERIKRKVFSTY